MQTNHANLERFVEDAGRLYTLPGVALKVLELTSQPTVDLRAVKGCIENDPALTGKILRVVNSSLFGLSRHVSDLNQALTLLGTKPLKLLVLGFSLPDALFKDLEGEILTRYWWHTLTKAVAARELTETYWQMPGDESFIGGLLQDLGMLVLIQNLGEPYVKLLERAFGDGGDLNEWEANALGFTHRQLSARLLEKWGLPRNVVQAIEQSENPFAATMKEPEPLTIVLRLAELLTILLTQQRTAVLPALLSEAQQVHGLDRSALAVLVQQLQVKVSQLSDALSLNLPSREEYVALMTRAHAQLAEVGEEVVYDLVSARAAEAVDDAQLLIVHEETAALAKAASALVAREDRSQASSVGKAAASEESRTAGVAVSRKPTDSVGREPTAATAARPTFAPAPSGADELLNRAAAAVNRCRAERAPLSVLLVAVDHPETLLRTRGTRPAERLLRQVQLLYRKLEFQAVEFVASRPDRAALVLPDCDRGLAVDLARQLLVSVRQLDTDANGKPSVSLSIGAATVDQPSKNFAAQSLIDAAQRCLQSAQAGGGNAVKSIGVY